MQLNTYDSIELRQFKNARLPRLIMWLEKLSKKKKKNNLFTLKPNFYLKLLEIHLNNKKNIIELIESMEELIHQKKSN